MSVRWHHILGTGLAVVGLAFAVAGVTGAGRSQATGGPGTIKVHTESDCSGSDHDPKPSETFYVGGTGFTAGVERWLAVTDGTNASDPVVIGPVSIGDSGTFCTGPYILPEGHYKVYVGTAPDVVTNNEKTKVFKVTGATDTTGATETSEPTETSGVTDTTGPPVTEPPVTEPPVTEPPVTEGPTSSVESEAIVPTTAAAAGGSDNLPTTGASTMLLAVGAAMFVSGVAVSIVGRRTS